MDDEQYEIHRTDSTVNFMVGAYGRISNLLSNPMFQAFAVL